MLLRACTSTCLEPRQLLLRAWQILEQSSCEAETVYAYSTSWHGRESCMELQPRIRDPCQTFNKHADGKCMVQSRGICSLHCMTGLTGQPTMSTVGTLSHPCKGWRSQCLLAGVAAASSASMKGVNAAANQKHSLLI